MKTKAEYEARAEQIISAAKTALAGGPASRSIDTTGMSEIGQHVFGQINNFSTSPETAAYSILRDGWSELSGIESASAAQDKIGEAAEEMGIEL